MDEYLQRTVPMVAFVAARSGIGKTTLLEKVIDELTGHGLRIVVLKHVHHANLDPAGKDSWRFRQAGARAVGLAAEGESIAILDPVGGDPRQLLPHLPEADLVLLEGFRGTGIPKIEVVRAESGNTVVTPEEDLLAIATDMTDLQVNAPIFPLDDAALLVDWLLKWMDRGTEAGTSLSHFDEAGRARMVDVSEKPVTKREAAARGEIAMRPETLALIKEGRMAKGDVLAVAQVAAIMAVKETSRLIPMCHPLNISGVKVDFSLNEPEHKVEIEVRVKLAGRTGVEMEALTGASVAALTIYDMCKAVDREMEIGRIRLVEKRGGRSGHFRREE